VGLGGKTGGVLAAEPTAEIGPQGTGPPNLPSNPDTDRSLKSPSREVDQGDWIELGIRTDTRELIDDHHRLLRSLEWWHDLQ